VILSAWIYTFLLHCLLKNRWECPIVCLCKRPINLKTSNPTSQPLRANWTTWFSWKEISQMLSLTHEPELFKVRDKKLIIGTGWVGKFNLNRTDSMFSFPESLLLNESAADAEATAAQPQISWTHRYLWRSQNLVSLEKFTFSIHFFSVFLFQEKVLTYDFNIDSKLSNLNFKLNQQKDFSTLLTYWVRHHVSEKYSLIQKDLHWSFHCFPLLFSKFSFVFVSSL